MKKVLLTLIAISATGSLFCGQVFNHLKLPIFIMRYEGEGERAGGRLEPGQDIDFGDSKVTIKNFQSGGLLSLASIDFQPEIGRLVLQ